MVEIKDSGERREFETGAVRDIQDGKGRCDLLPLDVVSWLTDDIHIVNAFVWNVVCCIWTCINKPELNDYANGG